MIKYFTVATVVIGVFFSGVYYENYRLVGEPDTTIAVMISALAISNSKYQLQLNSEYLALIENGQFDKLKEKIEHSNQLLSNVKSEAELVCKEASCSTKHMEVISNAIKN